MKIQNITNNQWLLTAGSEGKANLSRGSVQSEGVPLVKEEIPSEVEDLSIETANPGSRQDNLLEVIYPPFFPIGKTQVIFSVLNEPKTENERIATSMKANDADQKKASEKTSNQRQSDSDSTQELSLSVDDSSSASVERANAGSVLDLKA